MTAAQAAALPLNSTLYLPRLKVAIATIKTQVHAMHHPLR
jgi:hypothetical protein